MGQMRMDPFSMTASTAAMVGEIAYNDAYPDKISARGAQTPFPKYRYDPGINWTGPSHHYIFTPESYLKHP